MKKSNLIISILLFMIVFALHEGYGAASVYRPFLKINFNVHMVVYRYKNETVFAHVGDTRSGAYQLVLFDEYLYPSNNHQYGIERYGSYPDNSQLEVNELLHDFDVKKLKLNVSTISLVNRALLNEEEFNQVMINLKEYAGVVYYQGLLPFTYGKVVTPEKEIEFKTIWLIDFTEDIQNPTITQIK